MPCFAAFRKHPPRSPPPDRLMTREWRRSRIAWGRRTRQNCHSSDPENSGERRGRRAAVQLGAEPAGTGCLSARDPRVDTRNLGRPFRGCGGGHEQSPQRSGQAAGEFRAVRGRGKNRPGSIVLRCGLGAVMRTLAPAAERQARFCVPRHERGQGRQPEEQNQRDGKNPPHSTIQLRRSCHPA